MEKTIKLSLGFAAILLTAACSNDLDDAVHQYDPSTDGLTAVIPAYEYDEGELGTRVSVSDDLTTFTWNTGDQIGLYYSGVASEVSAAFTVKTGGSTVGEFYNEGFTLNGNETYYVFYPYDGKATTARAEMSYKIQTQSANNNADHIAQKSFMLANITTDAAGNPSTVNFSHLGAIMQFKLTPGSGTYKSLSVTSSKRKFRTKSKLNMKTGAIEDVVTDYTQTLNLNNITVADGEELVANMLVSPTDQSKSILTVTLTDTSNNTTSFQIGGKNMVSGKIYTFKHVENPTSATLVTGKEFNAAIKTLAAGYNCTEGSTNTTITRIKFLVNDATVSGVNVSAEETEASIYATYSSGVITIRTSAPVIKLGEDASYLFNYLTKLTVIEGLNNLDASDVTNMYYLFRQCQSLTTLDLTSFNTSNVTNMQGMFSNCTSLVNLNLSSFNTSNVTTFQSMFNYCSKLATLTLGENFLIGSGASTTTMCKNMATSSGAATITCMTATKTKMEASSNFPTTPTYTWVLLDGEGGSYEAGGSGYPWG